MARTGSESKRAPGNFWDHEDVLYLDCNHGYTTIHICQNSNCTLKMMNFTVCKLNFNKAELQTR